MKVELISHEDCNPMFYGLTSSCAAKAMLANPGYRTRTCITPPLNKQSEKYIRIGLFLY